MRTATFLLTLTLACSAFGGEIFIPATYRGEGGHGSVWRTEISVANVSSLTPHPVPVTITLYVDSATSVSIETPLAQNETLAVKDALRDWFDVESGGGIVRVTWDDANARISANARIYNVGSGGEFGQGVPAVRLDRLVSDQFLHGLSGINGNRTNIGISNPHNYAALVWVTLYDTSGLSRGSYSTMLEPRSYKQINDIFSQFNAGPLDAAMVRITSTNSSIYAYASVVRNDTGDATYIAPAD
ncbi:MAG TPA: hypothetical protein VF911_12080 [Thermoanaerobaculia bacterium]|jgi:hypothetical protein